MQALTYLRSQVWCPVCRQFWPYYATGWQVMLHELIDRGFEDAGR